MLDGHRYPILYILTINRFLAYYSFRADIGSKNELASNSLGKESPPEPARKSHFALVMG